MKIPHDEIVGYQYGGGLLCDECAMQKLEGEEIKFDQVVVKDRLDEENDYFCDICKISLC